MSTEKAKVPEKLRALSHQQMLMWTGQQLEPDSPIYNMANWIGIPTRIDSTAFQSAFTAIVNRSESLRATIEMGQGVPQLKINDEMAFDFPLIDFSQSSDPPADGLAWCERQCRTIFDLDKCLFDTALLKLGEESYVWYINHHHLICDAWGCSQLFRHLAENYADLKNGRPLQPLDFAPPFFRSSSTDAEQASPDELIPIEFYGSKPARIRSQSNRVHVIGGDDKLIETMDLLFKSPEASSYSARLSQHNVILTLLFAFLYRVSGQRELCVGLPFHNRLTPEEQATLGLYIRLFPLRIEIEGNETFRSLINKVRIATNDHLRNAMSGQSSAGSNANFNVVLNFIHASFGEFDSVPVKAVKLHPGCSDRQHHLRLHVENVDDGNQMSIQADLNTDVFDEAQQQMMVSHFRALVSAMGESWDGRLGSVDLVSQQERQLLESIQPAMSESGQLITERVGEVVEKLASQPAVRCQQNVLTYRELGEQVDQIASLISHQEFSPGSRIMICLDRSTEAVVAMLAILKSGHVFVPIDPNWPQQRISVLLADCQAVCVLTISQQPVSFPESVSRIDIDQINPTDVQTPTAKIEPTDTAYVLYTSGSTGQPKGVEVSHRSLAHYVNWAASYYGNNEPLSFPLFTLLTFDLTLTSIFIPLVTGGQVVVYPPQSNESDIALLNVIEDDLVDIIKLTPSHLSLLEGRQIDSSRVRQLILGGENLKLDLANSILRNFPPGLQIHNEYGPTEATVGCTVFSLNSDSSVDGVSVPIGQPIPGMQAFVLNEDLQSQPIGVPGELFLAGDGLASGYLGQPGFTADKFFPHPTRPATRIYRTGDIVRFLPDGNLEFLGRKDQQVKIRGARIELGAIETALIEHPEISQVVVTTYSSNSRWLEYCVRCGLASNYPDVEFDDQLVCSQCRAFESYRDQAQIYFQPLSELEKVFASQSRAADSEYDCIALLSGGKDSTYMLARLVDLDLKILAFTLDNGYISDEAKANIRRVVETLGVDHEFGSTSAMNQIFVDSLKRFSNVCQGCFKTIYTLSMNLALEKNIPFIVTGLSRGQFFETRLTEDLFREPCASLVQIDQTVLEARKAYHRLDDAVSRLLDVSHLRRDETFDEVQFVDFYRYCDVELDEMLDYLDRRLPWIRPSDTGRSTNCLINDVGIYVHQRNEGFHNYALPYSWDVRMGHKQRGAALEELQDAIDVDAVHAILQEIGYDGQLANPDQGKRLVAYYVAEKELDANELERHLESRLPAFLLPSRYIQLDKIPVTANGKVDLAGLPDPQRSQLATTTPYVAPADEIETQLARIWCEVLRVPKVGTRDNFFDLGGDSIQAIQIVARATRLGLRITPSEFFESLTVQKLAMACSEGLAADGLGEVVDPVLTPIQYWALDHKPQPNDYWNQSIQTDLPAEFNLENIELIRESLTFVCNFHQALRTKISVEDGKPTLLPPLSLNEMPLLQLDLTEVTSAYEQEHRLATVEEDLNKIVNFNSNLMLTAALIRWDAKRFSLLLTANHMAVDAVSWQHLLADLADCYQELSNGREPRLRPAPTYALWSHELQQAANEGQTASQVDYWISAMQSSAPLTVAPPIDDCVIGDLDRIVSQISAETTDRLTEKLRRGRVSLQELLLAALAQVLAETSGKSDFRIFVERHGREPIGRKFDFSRTVGWFTSLSPVRICLPQTVAPQKTLMEVKDRLRTVPQNGIGYGNLRYLHRNKEVCHSLATQTQEVVFNFLGKAVESDGRAFSIGGLKLHRSPSLKSFAAMEVNIAWDNQLRIAIGFNRKIFSSEWVEDLANCYVRQIAEMADGCSSEEGGMTTATDFPLANLNADQLKDLASIVKQIDSRDDVQQ